MYKIAQGSFRALRPGDADFEFSPDGITLVRRAAFEISNRCPENYRHLLAECISHGWIKPVAYIPDSEYAWDKLQS